MGLHRFAASLLALLAAPAAMAEDFSAGSEARSWNLPAEVPARFEARVVDILCALSGDCPEDCGAGRRQMGLERLADGVLVLVAKNNQPAFSGAAEELWPHCGAIVEVDGLMIEDPQIGAHNFYQLQRLRVQGTTEWIKANRWTRAWAERHPDAAGKGPWFRRDPRILGELATHGYLGLGPEADRPFIAEFYE